MVFKSLTGTAPSYLCELLTLYHPGRTLRSSDKTLLVVPKTDQCAGERTFAVAGPRLWNGLPASIRNRPSLNSFKTALKTHLFREAFDLNT